MCVSCDIPSSFNFVPLKDNIDKIHDRPMYDTHSKYNLIQLPTFQYEYQVMRESIARKNKIDITVKKMNQFTENGWCCVADVIRINRAPLLRGVCGVCPHRMWFIICALRIIRISWWTMIFGYEYTIHNARSRIHRQPHRISRWVQLSDSCL